MQLWCSECNYTCAVFMLCSHAHSHTGRSGVVLTFYSNQQCFDSLDGVRVSVNAATDHGVEFAEDLLNVCIHVLSYTLYIHSSIPCENHIHYRGIHVCTYIHISYAMLSLNSLICMELSQMELPQYIHTCSVVEHSV